MDKIFILTYTSYTYFPFSMTLIHISHCIVHELGNKLQIKIHEQRGKVHKNQWGIKTRLAMLFKKIPKGKKLHGE